MPHILLPIAVAILGLFSLIATPVISAGTEDGGSEEVSSYDEAKALVETGDFVAALPLLIGLTKEDPNNADVSTGGYNAATGAGSRAVEFVGTSVSSPGVNDPTGAVANSLKPANPHFKYINLYDRGYMLIDVDANRCVCEWWFVDTVASISNIQAFGVAFEVRDGSNRLQPSVQTPNRANPPALAP